MDNQAVGQRIRDARIKKGLTQEQLAEATGVHPTYISVIERGLKSPVLETFVPLCNALDVSADALLCDVIEASSIQKINEVTELLLKQPIDRRKLLLRMIKAAVQDD